jgi:hypothetical protein
MAISPLIAVASWDSMRPSEPAIKEIRYKPAGCQELDREISKIIRHVQIGQIPAAE